MIVHHPFLRYQHIMIFKRINIFLSSLVIFLQCYSQNSIVLSKEQMYEDFDQLMAIVQDYSPQIHIRKCVTGYDVIERMQSMRPRIEQIEVPADYYQFLSEVVACQIDAHSYMIDYHVSSDLYKYLAENNSFWDIDTSAIIAVVREHIKHTTSGKRFCFGNYLQYYDGQYYIMGNIRLTGGAKKTSLKDLILTHIDSIPIDEYVFNNFSKYLPGTVHWDFVHRKYYINPSSVFFPKGKFAFKSKDNGSPIIVDLSKYRNIFYEADTDPLSFYDKVIYFENEGILYIYIAQMKFGVQEQIINDIKEKCFEKDIRKVVIDVRNNPGGSDYVWIDILRYLTDAPIVIPNNMSVRSQPDLAAFYEKKHQINTYESVFLDNNFNCSESSDTIAYPSDSSINYKGIFYVLQDQNTKSAAHSLSSLCRFSERFVSIGIPTGTIGGMGIGPSLFQLDHSKFTFAMECDIDLTKITSPTDCFQDIPEIIVHPSLDEEITRRFVKTMSGKTEDYLLHHDSFFKEVMKQ